MSFFEVCYWFTHFVEAIKAIQATHTCIKECNIPGYCINKDSGRVYNFWQNKMCVFNGF